MEIQEKTPALPELNDPTSKHAFLGRIQLELAALAQRALTRLSRFSESVTALLYKELSAVEVSVHHCLGDLESSLGSVVQGVGTEVILLARSVFPAQPNNGISTFTDGDIDIQILASQMRTCQHMLEDARWYSDAQTQNLRDLVQAFGHLADRIKLLEAGEERGIPLMIDHGSDVSEQSSQPLDDPAAEFERYSRSISRFLDAANLTPDEASVEYIDDAGMKARIRCSEIAIHDPQFTAFPKCVIFCGKLGSKPHIDMRGSGVTHLPQVMGEWGTFDFSHTPLRTISPRVEVGQLAIDYTNVTSIPIPERSYIKSRTTGYRALSACGTGIAALPSEIIKLLNSFHYSKNNGPLHEQVQWIEFNDLSTEYGDLGRDIPPLRERIDPIEDWW